MKFSNKTYVTIGICAFGILFLSITFLGWYTGKFDDASNFSNTLAPLLSFFGSILVFYALKAQVKANKMIQEQFKHSLLLNSIETLNSRIINSNITIDNENYSGYSIFDKVLINLKNEQKELIQNFGIGILTSIPDKISQINFEHFIRAYSEEHIFQEELKQSAINLKKKLIDEGALSAVYLYQNFDINKIYENLQHTDLLERKEFINSLTNVYFHSMDGEFRMNIYELAFRDISEKYDIFLDSYFKSTFAILDSVYKSKKRLNENKEYLRNIFTNQEKILLFHKLMSGSTSKQFGIYLIELEMFNMKLNKKYFSVPMSLENYKKDIDYIKTLIYKE